MELFRIDSNFFYRLVGIKCERETLEYVLREMEKCWKRNCRTRTNRPHPVFTNRWLQWINC